MTGLSDEQLQFLRSKGIALHHLFDASGHSSTSYKVAMRATGKYFAYGTVPCARRGHTLRTRHGHCVQCAPEKISYMMRHHQEGILYIAGSQNTRMLKVGMTGDAGERLEGLNSVRYGGTADWRHLLTTSAIENAGRFETQIHRTLEPFRAAGTRVQGGVKAGCYELYKCKFTAAQEALLAVIPSGTSISTVPKAALASFC